MEVEDENESDGYEGELDQSWMMRFAKERRSEEKLK